MEGIFLGGGWVAKISNTFGVLEIPLFFWGGGVNGRCWTRAYE